MYADDTQAYKKTLLNMINFTIKRINEDLERLSTFSERNCLKINEGKSNFIIIGSRKQIRQLNGMQLESIVLNKKKIKRMTHTRNLGIEFDEHFSWSLHISTQIQKAYGKLKQLYRFKKFLSIKVKTRLVETYVLSQLSYGNTVTQNITKELQTKLQRVQNACYRFVYSIRKFDHITPYIKKANTLNMTSRTKYHGLTQLHKIVTMKVPIYLSNRITYRHNVHSRNTRNCNLINLQRLKKSVKQGSFFHKTIVDYNTLLSTGVISTSMTLGNFKNKCKNHLLGLQLTSTT